ncbi:hypothetical protein MYXO_03486 [Myxococcaceae bacterium]|jgi:uncharacterized membrane protein YdjX (TVP38/TMEM64 family)|nr:hypothetical protein MYXO_03486 [Myxococcaceae bacterium]
METGTDEEAQQPLVGPTRVLWKALALLALTVAGVIVFRATPLADLLDPDGATAHRIAELGPAGAVAFVVVMALAVLFGVPRLLFCPLAGALFGFAAGLGITTAATLVAYYTAFVFLRERHTASPPRLLLHPKLAFLGNDPGFGGVVIARLLPLPGMMTTVALSLSGVGHRAYLGGSAVGLVPEALPLVLLGAGLLEGDPRRVAELVVLAVLIVVGSFVLLQSLLRRRLRDASLDSSPNAEV